MSKPRRIKVANLPPRFPAWPTAIIALVLDRFHVPGMLEGAVWTLVALWWVAALVAVWQYEPVDVLAEKRVEVTNIFSGEPSPEAQRFIARALAEHQRRGGR